MMSNSSVLTDSIVDWLSFSLPVYPQGESSVQSVTFTTFRHYLPGIADILTDTRWKETSGRAPYDRSYSTLGWRIFASPNVPHIAIEVSGEGCKILRNNDSVLYLLAIVSDRLSRIDIATDMQTDIKPSDFVDAGFSGRIRSVGKIVSDTGETMYIGSQKSDRYCRVYRYNEPHERADLMRIEYVFRRKEARKVGNELVESSVAEIAAKAHRTYKWEHKVMDNLKAEKGLTASVAHRTAAGTRLWLIKQVAPAFKKLVAMGVIENPDEFIETYFKGEQSEDTTTTFIQR